MTELLGRSEYVTSSVVIPAVSYLRVQVAFSDNDLGFIAPLKVTLINDLTERMSNWPRIEKYENSTALYP